MEETNKQINRKKVLFSFIMLLLFLPLIQQSLDIFPKNNLRGSFELKKKPSLTTESWLKGEFQTKYQGYLNDHLGFRPFFVRIYNQMHFSFYNIAKANSVLVGRESMLFEENYIKAHLGLDYVGEKIIKDKAFKLKKIQDTLAKKGIDLIVMLAPGKASFYPEFIPESFDGKEKDSTNYKTYKKELLASEVNVLDFNKWFIDLKDTIGFNLFPKNGIHWSRSGQVLVIDSLLKSISKIHKVILPSVNIVSSYRSAEMIGSEQDIEDGMNLLVDIPDYEMKFPTIEYVGENVSNTTMLTVSDSYYGGMLNFDLNLKVFKNCENWYYNRLRYIGNQDSTLEMEFVNVQEEVEKNDVILIMATDANLYNFAFGFIEDLYDIYYTKLEDRKSYKKEQRILNFMEAMRSNPEQNKSIAEKAKKNNVSFEKELRENAKYLVWVEDGKP